jgi:hypothetical protein
MRHPDFNVLRQSNAIGSVTVVLLCSLLQVQAIKLEKTRLEADPARGTVAVGTGEYEEYPVQLVLKSIGYKSLPLPGLPFDNRQGVVPNAAGRVLTGALLHGWLLVKVSCQCWHLAVVACQLAICDAAAGRCLELTLHSHRALHSASAQVLITIFHFCCICCFVNTDVGAAAGSTVPGLYVCGWLKRGPTGIIGTNLTDAEETVASMAQDYATITQAPEAAPGRAGLQQLLSSRGVDVVDYAAWEQLNAFEVGQGQQQGSVRVKCASWDELLGAAGVRPQHAAGR